MNWILWGYSTQTGGNNPHHLLHLVASGSDPGETDDPHPHHRPRPHPPRSRLPRRLRRTLGCPEAARGLWRRTAGGRLDRSMQKKNRPSWQRDVSGNGSGYAQRRTRVQRRLGVRPRQGRHTAVPPEPSFGKSMPAHLPTRRSMLGPDVRVPSPGGVCRALRHAARHQAARTRPQDRPRALTYLRTPGRILYRPQFQDSPTRVRKQLKFNFLRTLGRNTKEIFKRPRLMSWSFFTRRVINIFAERPCGGLATN
jgi:hypothetical protein